MKQRINIGDTVVWKEDIERYGKVVRMNGNALTVKCWDSMIGEHYETVVDSRRCDVE